MQRLSIFIVALTILLGYVSLNQVEAATLTVSSLADSGTGTLREAITTASQGDIIDFSISGTIALASNLPDIDKRLTIDGTGQTVTLQGGTDIRSLHGKSRQL